MADLLRMDYINSLPQPLMATFYGGDEWPLYDIDVQTGLLKIDVVGMLDIKHIGDVKFLTDIDGTRHDVETLYVDYESQSLEAKDGD